MKYLSMIISNMVIADSAPPTVSEYSSRYLPLIGVILSVIIIIVLTIIFVLKEMRKK